MMNKWHKNPENKVIRRRDYNPKKKKKIQEKKFAKPSNLYGTLLYYDNSPQH